MNSGRPSAFGELRLGTRRTSIGHPLVISATQGIWHILTRRLSQRRLWQNFAMHDRIEQLPDQPERIDLVVVFASRKAQ